MKPIESRRGRSQSNNGRLHSLVRSRTVSNNSCSRPIVPCSSITYIPLTDLITTSCKIGALVSFDYSITDTIVARLYRAESSSPS
jgi:hypothetical protein